VYVTAFETDAFVLFTVTFTGPAVPVGGVTVILVADTAFEARPVTVFEPNETVTLLLLRQLVPEPRFVPVMSIAAPPLSGPVAREIEVMLGALVHANAISASMARVTGATTRSVATRDATRRRATAKLPFGPTRSPSVFVVTFPTRPSASGWPVSECRIGTRRSKL
jgi:hypothetical protein